MEEKNPKPKLPIATIDLGAAAERWRDLQARVPRRDSFRAVCYFSSFVALVHLGFAWAPVKWPMFVMDAFSLAIGALILSYERLAENRESKN